MDQFHIPFVAHNLRWALILILLVSFLLPPVSEGRARQDPVAAKMAAMSVEERVGQLFIVSFVGTDSQPGSQIAQLITDYHVGGVVLQAANSNFQNDANAPEQISNLVNQLQNLALNRKGAPLFIAIDQEGDGFPYSRITGGTTPIPSEMAIGATWDAANAEAVGQIVGQELSSMGINLLLGPVIDVLNNPRPTGKGDLGIRTFGGDPFWVGSMGRAYIRGVHASSNGRMAVVAKHFPGHGESDRLPDEEVATIDKSISELRRIELAPFFVATALQPADPLGAADALMSSHIRFRGLQGDIRQFTIPISFDPEGLTTLLGLSEFIPWRDNGGLVISDALGVPAVRKYYDPTLQSFPHRRIAKEAFLAGNNVLILSQFDLNSVWDAQFANIKDTIYFFQNEYRQNNAFAAKVDESVFRILQLKERLYPEATISAVRVDPQRTLDTSGHGITTVENIARSALTLIYPSDYHQYRPPQGKEKILIISDSRQVRECYIPSCQLFEPLPADALQKEILRIYGQGAAGMVDPEQINSITYSDLKRWLTGQLAPIDGGEAKTAGLISPEEVAKRIQEANWLVFLGLDIYTSRFPDSDALKLFLSQAEPLLLDKKLVVLALNAPYYLDTTEMSKFTAFFALYSKTPSHIETAARALFGEAIPQGASPVDIQATGYSLADALSPDPGQSLPVTPVGSLPVSMISPVRIKFHVGPVLDGNGRAVPDGTTVEFIPHYRDGIYPPPVESMTVDGIGLAEGFITFEHPGTVEVIARSGKAQSHEPYVLEIKAPPTPTATATSTESPTPTATPEPTSTATIIAKPETTATSAPAPENRPSSPPTEELIGERAGKGSGGRTLSALDLLTSLAAIILAMLLSFQLQRNRKPTPSRSIQIALLTLIGGLSAYLLYGLGWLRPEAWLFDTRNVTIGRFTLAILSFGFGLLVSRVDPRIMVKASGGE